MARCGVRESGVMEKGTARSFGPKKRVRLKREAFTDQSCAQPR